MRSDPKAVLVLVLFVALATACSRPAQDTASPAAPVATGSPPPSQPPASAGDADPASPARLDGYGPLRLGMPEAQLRSAWDGALSGAAAEPDACHYLTPSSAQGSPAPAFMVEAGRFVRYDVRGTDPVAPGGGRVGMDVASLRERYAGRIEAQPHKYLPGAQVLRVAGDGAALVFETDAASKVARWRVGLVPQVDYVEGCG